MNETIDKVQYASLLYDFYAELLNESQREVMALYHEDNLSLSEIAEELGQSRQAVHYTLKKAEAALRTYEQKLGLIESYENNRKLAVEASEIIEKLGGDSNAKDRLYEIIELLTD